MRVMDGARMPRPDINEPIVVGGSPGLRRVVEIARRIAPGNAKVLITGESGVGKDVIARLIHANSSRADQRYVALNCASFSESLLESELFGHAKGSFTGAIRDRVGKLQWAHRGTIFLDEIGEMSLRMQAMLLRFLENGEIQPVGSDGPALHVDVRVIAATNRDLLAMVSRGEFREDLLYRIRVAHIDIPPLRDRREDIRPLVQHIVARSGQALTVNAPALAALEAYRWPGNIRELQNVVEQMIAMADGIALGVDQLPHAVAAVDRVALTPGRERRRRIADDIFEKLTTGGYQFWEHVYPAFISRDLTRADLRQLVAKGLTASGGNYRGVLRLFGMPDADYKRFLNFLSSHDCTVDFRDYRPSTRGATLGGADPLFAPVAAAPAPFALPS